MSNVGKSLADPFQQPWDDDEPDAPLLLYENQARRYGVSEADIEAAKERALPCPREWPTPAQTWRIMPMIPKRVGTWEGVKFHEQKRRKR